MNSNVKSNLRLAATLAASLLTCFAFHVAEAFDSPATVTDAPLLSLIIRCTNAVVKAGDEIPIEFRITNRGTNDYKYADRTYDRSGRMDEYSLIAKTESGKVVSDPRSLYKAGWFGGGLFGYQVLKPSESFTKIIPLNRWALINEPGRYVVVGTYPSSIYSTISTVISSAPISITVLPRTPQEMADYIKDVTNQIATLPAGHDSHGKKELDALVMKLMFTCSPRIVPTLLKTMYEYEPGYGGFWESEALLFYVPRSDETKQAMIATAAKRGLAEGMQHVLTEYGCRSEELEPLIERSLAAENPQSWAAGALAAQQYANDVFTPRLIAVATEPQNAARERAIYALAANRTDESVKTLKALLDDPDPKIRETTERAIRISYSSRGIWQGRQLKVEDFDEKYRQPQFGK
jgi:hypothetical protein